jgi:mono/diheme cytochrome c family protein
MARQPSYRPDEPSSFFLDGRSNRPLVRGTVARGHLRVDNQLYRGALLPAPARQTAALSVLGSATGGAALVTLMAARDVEELNAVTTFPFPVTEEVLALGQNRYMIYCVVCHDVLGTGQGIVVERGYTPPPSFHISRLREARVGHFFQAITEGYGSMPSYRKQVPPRDRWAIVAYVRALQLSQHFAEADLPDDLRQALAQAPNRPEPGGQR